MAQMSRPNAFTESSQKRREGSDILRFRNADGSAMAVAAAAGVFGVISGGYGVGGTKLQGEAASGNTKTSTAKLTYGVPQNYVAAGSFSIVVRARVTALPNTGATIAAQLYKQDGQGGVSGSNQVTTAATAISAAAGAWADFTFAVTSTSLSPGDELDLYLQGVNNDSGGATGCRIEVGSVYFSMDTKM